jgi:hypothetical protein
MRFIFVGRSYGALAELFRADAPIPAADQQVSLLRKLVVRCELPLSRKSACLERHEEKKGQLAPSRIISGTARSLFVI